jgi:hypothetical protein
MLPELAADLASPDAALHLGPQLIVLETAARELAASTVGIDRLQAVSSHVMFLARGKAGPFRVEGSPAAGTEDVVAARLVLHDEGAGDRPITSASFLFRTI